MIMAGRTKTSRYATKRRMQGRQLGIVNAAAFVNVIDRCLPMGETAPIVQGFARGNDTLKLLIEAQDAANGFARHTIAHDNTAPYDCLACVIDVSLLRALEIDPNEETNPMLPDLIEGRDALLNIRARWERTGRWGTSATERQAMLASVAHYETILNASSPEQMHRVEQVRIDALVNTEAQGRR